MRYIYTDKAPAPGAYSQAVVVDCGEYERVSLAGQTGNIPDGKDDPVIDGGFGPQTTQALKNIAAVLKAAGGQVSDIAKFRVILKDTELPGFQSVRLNRTDARKAFNEAYVAFLAEYGLTKEKGNLPARTMFWASEVPLEEPIEGTLVEIEIDPVEIRKGYRDR